ncbi:unnamed protein product [Fraxinus pennsylvanica]|uniref:Uncharacterized protein n=1 Tax=Fraxinus pennsylvanica TaxID=56036 RepID=A0AAD1ZFY3_9LAMI|nr:unnamed protein product [Fraxinus pennsylvanica]
MFHNELLQRAIEELKIDYPNTVIIYDDYYNVFTWVLSQARFHGFDLNSVQKACCGAGGSYNLNPRKMCGAPGIFACPNPYSYISWDGIHLTQHAHKLMAEWLIRSIFPQLQFQI